MEDLRPEVDALYKYVTRCDARILAFQMIIPDLLGQDADEKERFRKDLNQNYELILKGIIQNIKSSNYELYLRLYGDSQDHLEH